MHYRFLVMNYANNIKVFREIIVDSNLYYEHFRIADEGDDEYIVPYAIYAPDEHQERLQFDD